MWGRGGGGATAQDTIVWHRGGARSAKLLLVVEDGARCERGASVARARGRETSEAQAGAREVSEAMRVSMHLAQAVFQGAEQRHEAMPQQ
eukprot:SAG11_NODE_639_length_8017_cov_4.086259_8_plen_90_part_00